MSYLSIYWTNFCDLFTKWKVFAWIFLIRSSFSDSLGTLPWQPILCYKQKKAHAISAIFYTIWKRFVALYGKNDTVPYRNNQCANSCLKTSHSRLTTISCRRFEFRRFWFVTVLPYSRRRNGMAGPRPLTRPAYMRETANQLPTNAYRPSMQCSIEPIIYRGYQTF